MAGFERLFKEVTKDAEKRDSTLVHEAPKAEADVTASSSADKEFTERKPASVLPVAGFFAGSGPEALAGELSKAAGGALDTVRRVEAVRAQTTAQATEQAVTEAAKPVTPAAGG
jgi:hypothetical protein